MEEQNLKAIAWILGIVLLGGGGWFVGKKLIDRHERRQRAEAAQVAQEAVRKEADPMLAELAKLRKAAMALEKKMGDSGQTLPAGTLITLKDLEKHQMITSGDLNPAVKIKGFAYAVLPAEAAPDVIQMELVTEENRAVVSKKGEGTLLGK
jgi:hypothetical protein